MFMLIEKKCKMCGTEFEGRTNACYCSNACKRQYNTEYAKRYRDNHREKITRYNREYWRRTHEQKTG